MKSFIVGSKHSTYQIHEDNEVRAERSRTEGGKIESIEKLKYNEDLIISVYTTQWESF